MTIIKARHEDRDNQDETTPVVAEGKLRYRVNCLGKLIIQVKEERFISGKGWRRNWIDAKPHHVIMIDE